jgi:hypothetical protein
VVNWIHLHLSSCGIVLKESTQLRPQFRMRLERNYIANLWSTPMLMIIFKTVTESSPHQSLKKDDERDRLRSGSSKDT